MTEQPIFRESQHFSRLLLVPLLLLTLVPAVIVLLYGVTEWSVLVVLFGPLVVTIVLLMRLITEVSSSGIRVGLRPFPSRRILGSEIARAYVRMYRPLLEYGGWGIRWGLHGKAYNARGNFGVQLELTDGRRVLIGSQRPEELLAAIRQVAPWVQDKPFGQAV